MSTNLFQEIQEAANVASQAAKDTFGSVSSGKMPANAPQKKITVVMPRTKVDGGGSGNNKWIFITIGIIAVTLAVVVTIIVVSRANEKAQNQNVIDNEPVALHFDNNNEDELDFEALNKQAASKMQQDINRDPNFTLLSELRS